MSIESLILPLLIVIPLIGAVATLFMGGEKQKYAKWVAGVFSGITLIVTLYTALSLRVPGLFLLSGDSGHFQITLLCQHLESGEETLSQAGGEVRGVVFPRLERAEDEAAQDEQHGQVDEVVSMGALHGFLR